MNGVNNRRSAALFFQQNSMTLAALGLSPTVSHHAGGAVAATYLFHRDAGLLTIAPPNALANGPWQRGWVQGHEIVTNWKHRFIEHVHVNKKQPDGFEIYNGTKDDATKVETWIKGAGKKLATPAKSEEIAIATALTKAAADQRARDLETVAQ